jgi:hypothetical protein
MRTEFHRTDAIDRQSAESLDTHERRVHDAYHRGDATLATEQWEPARPPDNHEDPDGRPRSNSGDRVPHPHNYVAWLCD